ncbi:MULTISPECIES: phosphate ABC transporter ATP-binding protein [unclassified Lysinibacillus]|uniref:ABC transporter ATP-binding protein n=1 Tax=unclassified Lysinibacillus TaxID=2636778 RepID=UPI002012B265|nr:MULTISPECIES: phosphate ABC transporter ATP-binding protein [unclassified Lysinibacillus]MCL1698296.1 phosphate ABC transporter ATP-binding protein [Lysinibacillus sp. BPa_S21]MCL1703312.1 phosphate ABC transporter ATP-binding protein [Lysinibacillus sp. Bpr_S20]
MNISYEPAIHFQQVTFSSNDKMILKSITGSFPKGKITTLVGPSGAGKTTLLKLCNGLLSPTDGQILIDNQVISAYEPTALRRHVGMALQAAPMIEGTVFDNLALPRTLQGEKLTEQEAIQYLQDVGLDQSFLQRPTNKLSGGQRQKVSIARTLINQSSILLLDEITSALDRQSVQEIETLIATINNKFNVTIIWITHNLQQALTIGHYTWVMMDGELIETGKSSLLNAPKNPRVAEFVQGVNA